MIIKIMQNLFKNRYVKAIKCVIFLKKQEFFFKKCIPVYCCPLKVLYFEIFPDEL